MEAFKRNHVELSGNLGRDPELRFTKAGKEVLSINIAVNDYKKAGDKFEVVGTHWFTVVMWEPIPNEVKALRKGDKVSVQGRLATRSWNSSNNEKRFVTEIVAKEIRPSEKKITNAYQSSNMGANKAPLESPSFSEEELPF